MHLHAADNEHINMYIPRQVNARLALHFTAQSRVFPVSAGTSKLQLLHQRKKEKYSSELLSGRMTDWLADETQRERNIKVRKNKNRYSNVD